MLSRGRTIFFGLCRICMSLIIIDLGKVEILCMSKFTENIKLKFLSLKRGNI